MSDDLKRSSVLGGADLVFPSAPRPVDAADPGAPTDVRPAPGVARTAEPTIAQLDYMATASTAQTVTVAVEPRETDSLSAARPHLNAEGEFQSDKYPTCPAGKVPLSVKDPTAQDLLWQYAQRRRAVDADFAADLKTALKAKGYVPPGPQSETTDAELAEAVRLADGTSDGVETAWLKNAARRLARAEQARRTAADVARLDVRAEPYASLVAEHRGLAVKALLMTLTEDEAGRLVDVRAEMDRIETAMTERYALVCRECGARVEQGQGCKAAGCPPYGSDGRTPQETGAIIPIDAVATALRTQIAALEEQSAGRLASLDFLCRSLGDILRCVGAEPHSNPSELVAQIAELVKPKKLPWETGNKYLKPGVTGPHEIRKVAPGTIVETVDGDFAVRMVSRADGDWITVAWIKTGVTSTIHAMSSVMAHPAPSEEVATVAEADRAARDRTNRGHWTSSGLPGPYIEDAEDRTSYLLNEHDRLSSLVNRLRTMGQAKSRLLDESTAGAALVTEAELAETDRLFAEYVTNGTPVPASVGVLSLALRALKLASKAGAEVRRLMGGARKERNRTYMIGVDIGGAISKYPDIMLPIMRALSAGGIEVHVVTDMPIKKALAMLTLNDVNIPASRVHSCDYEAHGDACKAIKAQELGLDMLWDDCLGYVSSGAPPVRMLVMPDGDRDYYHPSWKTDGAEGEFGRRLQRVSAAGPEAPKKCQACGAPDCPFASNRGDVPSEIRAAATPLNLSALAATVPPDVMAAARAEARAEYTEQTPESMGTIVPGSPRGAIRESLTGSGYPDFANHSASAFEAIELSGHLGMDSLAVAELAFDVESSLGIAIVNDELRSARTIGDIARAAEQAMAQKASK